MTVGYEDLLTGFSWTGTTGNPAYVTVSFALPTWLWDMDNSPDIEIANPALMSAFEQGRTEYAMQEWANVSNINWDNVGASLGDLTNVVIRKADGVTLSGAAQIGLVLPYTNGGEIGHADVAFDKAYLSALGAGSFGYRTILHEMGHVVCLTDVDTVSGAYSMDVSIMSKKYGLITSSTREAVTPMIYDIAAAQFLYGKNTSYHSGNTTYSFAAGGTFNGMHFTGGSYAWTIWDAGGMADIFDLSGATSAVKLDLRGGVDSAGSPYFSEIGDERVAIAFDPANASGVVDIEKAIGGQHNDTIIGGVANNSLDGRAGDDSILGGDGDDTIFGSLGADTLDGGTDNKDIADFSGLNQFVVANLPAQFLLNGGQFGVIKNFEHLIGTAYNDFLIGNGNNNTLEGGAGDDRLSGNGGSDQLIGGVGNDTLEGGDGDDRFTVQLGLGSQTSKVILFPFSKNNALDTKVENTMLAA